MTDRARGEKSFLEGMRMSLLNRLKGHTSVEYKEAEGLSCALDMVRMSNGRTFQVRGRTIRASHVPSDEVARFLQEELPRYYTYTAKVQTYVDRHRVHHACVEIKGWIGLSRRMNRYNPFDWTCTIKTEAPATTGGAMNEREEKRYIYGPVPSRRLGRSLGVDLVPYKTCTYDCIYCQLGRTTCKTTERKEWVPTKAVVAQLKDKLDSKPDYITLSGSGEPTLYARIEQLIHEIKSITSIPVAVITNGSLLWLAEVQRSLLDADLIVPSLDAGSEDIFQYVNRPHPQIGFDQMLQGLREFRRLFHGRYWLEVFLLSGVTTVEARIKALRDCIQTIAPDKVQINTVVRPPAESYATPVPLAQLEEIAVQLHPKAELIVPCAHTGETEKSDARDEDILDLLCRRPCSLEDIATGLRLHPQEVAKCIGRLVSEQRVCAKEQRGTLCYEAVSIR
jgi:wyosine [tRNA(Phe)-imidazoG37] synthetase (radical SAM superfamily)